MTSTLAEFANSYVSEKSTLAKEEGAFSLWTSLTVKPTLSAPLTLHSSRALWKPPSQLL